MADSRIEWTDKTWNPTTGCAKGCSYCYARTMAGRLQKMGQEKYRDGFTPTCHPGELEKPLHWNKPCRIFVNSMGDLFDPAIPFEFIDRVMNIIFRSPRHIFQILTKNAERMSEYFSRIETPPPNLWLGVTITSQADFHRWWTLYYTIAAIRFISFEPLTGPIRFDCLHCHGKGHYDDNNQTLCPMCKGSGQLLDRLDWVIAGGMTGKDAAPLHPDWIRSLRDQCKAADVPFFFKQWGSGESPLFADWIDGMSAGHFKAKGSELDGCQWKQFPGIK